MVRSAPRTYRGNLALTNHLGEIFQFCGANDGCSDLLRAPGQRDLGHLDTLLVSEFLDARGRRSVDSSCVLMRPLTVRRFSWKHH